MSVLFIGDDAQHGKIADERKLLAYSASRLDASGKEFQLASLCSASQPGIDGKDPSRGVLVSNERKRRFKI